MPDKPKIDFSKLGEYSQPPKSPAALAPKWLVQTIDGERYGPYSLNDLENFAVQGRLTLESMIFHPEKTNNNWVAVARIPRLSSLITNHATASSHVNAARQLVKRESKPRYSSSSATTILVSAIANIVVGLIWLSLCFTFPLAICLWVLSAFEFTFYAKHKKKSLSRFRSDAFLLGVFEIIAGLVNTVTLICGILTLINRPPEDD